MQFKDHFSKSSKIYSEARPQYPEELFEYIISFVNERDTAWDCATGNGQAAVTLAKYFEKVIATDASEEQLKNANSNLKITYYKATAEDSKIDSNTINLITTATAAHWFDPEKFYNEVKRVSKKDAIIALWSYGENDFDDKVCDKINDFAFKDMLEYWPKEARSNWEDKYKNLYFPFEEIPFPHIEMKANWDLERLIGYIKSWSAVKIFKEKYGKDPVSDVYEKLSEAWGDKNKTKEIKWILHGRIGRVK